MVTARNGIRLALAILAVLGVAVAEPDPPRKAESPGTEQFGTQYVRTWLAGRVVVEGGSVPPQRVAVTMNCGGLPRPQAYTEPNGHFGFEPSFAPALPSYVPASDDPRQIDVEAGGGEDLLSGLSGRSSCRLSAELPGYSSSQLHVGFLGPGGTTLLSDSNTTSVGEIVLRLVKRFAGNSVSETMSHAPPIALEDYEEGMRQLRLPGPDGEQAALHLERALQAYPAFAQAWVALGEARWILGKRAEATQAFTRSINADPRFLPPYEMLIYLT